MNCVDRWIREKTKITGCAHESQTKNKRSRYVYSSLIKRIYQSLICFERMATLLEQIRYIHG